MKTVTNWIVFVGKKEYKLTEDQYNFMKGENMKNGTQTFWFDTFTISLPHVSSMDKVTEVVSTMTQLPNLSPVEHNKARERVKEIKEALHTKLQTEKEKKLEARRIDYLKQQARIL